jgi:hypothetical protein
MLIDHVIFYFVLLLFSLNMFIIVNHRFDNYCKPSLALFLNILKAKHSGAYVHPRVYQIAFAFVTDWYLYFSLLLINLYTSL